ncbi:nucleotide exchange factor GrpE [Paenibacillus sp. IB182496]|uniref:Protein GrpE n=1 Tax=Paenibacillus sabuli TaxID=2772509 RepID=A0A927GQP2_9BACL|nr:nucleotide exchange factor GrpE [Paenibacillus sabuli]MBD2844471.1 nucleotide exchange factor GrpE [Paenibacillus sabuli]
MNVNRQSEPQEAAQETAQKQAAEEQETTQAPEGQAESEATDQAQPATDADQEQDAHEQQAEAPAEDPRIAALEREAAEHQQRLVRAQADFDNYRRRTQKEKEELARYASMKLITELLPIVDNFERALAAAQDSGDQQSLVKGVDMIFRQLDQVLGQEGLKAMETVGQPFNPDYHQAIMQVESEEHEEGVVVEEVQKGYMLKDKVLRPAMVKVSG